MIDLYGWSDALQRAHAQFLPAGTRPARVVAQHRSGPIIVCDDGEQPAAVAGRLLFEAAAGALPVVGDWVAVSPAGVIEAVLPRHGEIARRAAGSGERRQVIAANVDVGLVATSLNADYSPRRVERFLTLLRAAEVAAVVLLTKADLADDVAARCEEMCAVAGDAPVLVVASLAGEGLDAVRGCIGAGQTAVILGMSGVGKSTLVNALAGRTLMATRDIRHGDDRGRHTTTHRELFRLPGGGLILDTPGVREVGLVDAEEGVADTFADIAELETACRFSNCRHGSEPGCAIRAALADGTLDAGRWASFGKLKRDEHHAARKVDPDVRRQEKLRWAKLNKDMRTRVKFERDQG